MVQPRRKVCEGETLSEGAQLRKHAMLSVKCRIAGSPCLLQAEFAIIPAETAPSRDTRHERAKRFSSAERLAGLRTRSPHPPLSEPSAPCPSIIRPLLPRPSPASPPPFLTRQRSSRSLLEGEPSAPSSTTSASPILERCPLPHTSSSSREPPDRQQAIINRPTAKARNGREAGSVPFVDPGEEPSDLEGVGRQFSRLVQSEIEKAGRCFDEDDVRFVEGALEMVGLRQCSFSRGFRTDRSESVVACSCFGVVAFDGRLHCTGSAEEAAVCLLS